MIIFEKVRYKNLLSSGNYWTEIELNGNQNTLIVGANGAGKSTVLDAIFFALFNEAFRDINKPLLVNAINQKDCLVELFFTTSGKKYKIVRGIKPNVFEIYQDDVLINKEASNVDYQEILEKNIVKYNKSSFTQIVILGSATFKPFMQLKTSDRRSVIEDLLGINIFTTMNVVTKEKLSVNKDEISKTKSKIDLLKQSYMIHESNLETLRQMNEDKINEITKDIDDMKRKNSVSSMEIDSLSFENDELGKKIVKKSVLEDNIKKLYKMETTIEGKIKTRQETLHFFCDNDKCPTCQQNIDDQFKSNMVSAKEKELEELQSGLQKLRERIFSDTNTLSEMESVSKKIQENKIKIAVLNRSIDENNGFISRSQKQIEKLLSSKNNITNEEKMLKQIENDISDGQKELQKLLTEREGLEYIQTILKDSGIKTKIIKQYIPIINKSVNKFLNALDFYVNFNLDESFKETIKSRHRDEFTYNNFSEGEKQRIDMALMLTWRHIARLRNTTNTNLLFLDEIFDSSLDSDGTEFLMNILHSMEDINLFVISHKGDILNDKFDNVITFEKVKNFSRMRVSS